MGLLQSLNLDGRWGLRFFKHNWQSFEGKERYNVGSNRKQRTSFHKGFFLGPEYLNNILGTNGHIKGTCIAANFESNGPLVWCLLCIKSGWGNSIPVLPEVIN